MVGIDDLAYYIPKFCLNIDTLSEHRNLSYDKLNKGLGLEKMAIPNHNEDAATMAANAVKTLIERNNIPLEKIGRIYVGTESAFDGAKPVASYVLGMLEDYFEAGNAFRHTDVVDVTFACIGGVDAFLNTLDWIRADEERIGIVVSTDNAKYGLNSPGEYTQGAGAVAMLLKSHPRLMDIHQTIGVACKSEHDFFKPLRSLYKYIDEERSYIKIHDATPIFDGKFSNACYADRLREAFEHFKGQKVGKPLEEWQRVIFHLPYAFHGKRIFSEIFMMENKLENPDLGKDENIKVVYKSSEYQAFVNEKLEKGQRASSLIGNMYTASIWMSLMSTLTLDLAHKAILNKKKIGFCSYGSGSKAKVFEGTLKTGWEAIVKHWRLFEVIEERQSIDFEVYEALHNANCSSLYENDGKFVLSEINDAPLEGQRNYKWVDHS